MLEDKMKVLEESLEIQEIKNENKRITDENKRITQRQREIEGTLEALRSQLQNAQQEIDTLKKDNEQLRRELQKNPEPKHLFDRSNSPKFAECFESFALKANRIVLIGIGLNILNSDPLRNRLIDKAAEGKCHLEIYLANPFSPAIQHRLIEEETGDERPGLGKDGIIKRIQSILEQYHTRQKDPVPTFTFKLFSNYLTMALLILDDDYFLYPYGYAYLGNYSPVTHYTGKNSAHQPMIEFLEKQYERIKRSAMDAQLLYDLYKGHPIEREKLISFAVYIVPEKMSDLYQFGSKVLGYDIRNHCAVESPWANYVGDAVNFGFHVTIADALYFAHQSNIEFVSKTIEVLAKEFKPFQLHFDLTPGFPNERTIALKCREEESGTLEALHHELVFQCYRQAVASNYSLGLASPDRDHDKDRAKLMIQRYHAPYILKRFQPHFTLLSNLPDEKEKIEQITKEITELFEDMVKEPQVNIKSLALMTRTNMDHPWQIAEEIKLG